MEAVRDVYKRQVDGMTVFENEEAKRKFFYISDEQYFFSNATPVEMMEYYRIVYPGSVSYTHLKE